MVSFFVCLQVVRRRPVNPTVIRLTMNYTVTDEIASYLPPKIIDVKPLEYEWDEAANAIVFVSSFAFSTFEKWNSELSQIYRSLVRDGYDLNIESHEDLGCTSFWFNHLPNVDVHVARCQNTASVENLNSWVGSTDLESLATIEGAATVGLCRIRPA